MEYTVTRRAGRFAVSGLDTQDGEVAVVSGVEWSAGLLSFTSRIESTGWVVRNSLRLVTQNEVELTTIRAEAWYRKQ